MKLAEALLLRADRNRSLEQLKQRIQVSARYQEGEQPPEDARDLVAAASAVLDELEVLIRHINRTNSGTVMPDGRSPMRSPSETCFGSGTRCSRFRPKRRRVGHSSRGFIRATRSELKYLRALDVKDLRQQASDVARQAASSMRGFSRSTGRPSCRRHDQRLA